MNGMIPFDCKPIQCAIKPGNMHFNRLRSLPPCWSHQCIWFTLLELPIFLSIFLFMLFICHLIIVSEFHFMHHFCSIFYLIFQYILYSYFHLMFHSILYLMFHLIPYLIFHLFASFVMFPFFISYSISFFILYLIFYFLFHLIFYFIFISCFI